MKTARSRRAKMTLAGALVVTACVGCWEEVRYTPPTRPDTEQLEPLASAASDAGAETIPDEPTPAVAPVAVEPAPELPTTDQLFGQEANEASPPAEADAIAPTPAEAPTSPPFAAPEIAAPPVVEDAASASAGPQPSSTPTLAERRLAWGAASKWSLAAAIYAKGLEASRYEPPLAEAREAASAIGVELPPLPTADGGAALEAAVIESLRGESAVAIGNRYAERLGATEAAAADLALRSHLLLLTYSPRSSDSALQADALRRAAVASGLPAAVWEPLLDRVVERAPFVDVRQAVFELHRRAAEHLATETDDGFGEP